MSGAVPDSADTPMMRQYLEIKEALSRLHRLLPPRRLLRDVLRRRRGRRAHARPDAHQPRQGQGRTRCPCAACRTTRRASYLARLVARGLQGRHREQVEDPKLGQGHRQARRSCASSRPGTVIDDEQLEPTAAHYLVAAASPAGRRLRRWPMLDVTTGEFAATQLPTRATCVDELARLEPREMLCTPALDERASSPRCVRASAPRRAELPAPRLYNARARRAELAAATVGALPRDDRGARARRRWRCARPSRVVSYAAETQPSGALPLTQLLPYEPVAAPAARRVDARQPRALRHAHGRQEARARSSASSTSRAPRWAARLLRRWLAAPLVDVAADPPPPRRRRVAGRARARARRAARASSPRSDDLERLAGRATLGVATPARSGGAGAQPRAAAALRALLARVVRRPTPRRALAPSRAARAADGDEALRDVAAEIARDAGRRAAGAVARRRLRAPRLRRRARRAARPVRERQGQDPRARGARARAHRHRLAQGPLQPRLRLLHRDHRARTSTACPADYVRKQTLANAERYVTAELDRLRGQDRSAPTSGASRSSWRRSSGCAARSPRRRGASCRWPSWWRGSTCWPRWPRSRTATATCRPEVDDGLTPRDRRRPPPGRRELRRGGRASCPTTPRSIPTASSSWSSPGPTWPASRRSCARSALIVLLAQMG